MPFSGIVGSPANQLAGRLRNHNCSLGFMRGAELIAPVIVANHWECDIIGMGGREVVDVGYILCISLGREFCSDMISKCDHRWICSLVVHGT